MGDGRYYTLTQFWNVLFLALSLCLLVVFLVTLVFKTRKYRKFFIFGGVQLILVLLFEFVSQVIVQLKMVHIFHLLSVVFLLFYLLVGIVFYAAYWREQRKINSKEKSYEVKLFWSLGGFFLVMMIYLLFRQSLRLAIVLFFIHFVLSVMMLMEYQISLNVFNDARNMILDYVFITLPDGEIVFQSDKALKSKLFQENFYLDIGDVKSIFQDRTEYSESRENIILVYPQSSSDEFGGKIRYFQYRRKTFLNDRNQDVYIFTFVDVTPLIENLNNIENERTKLKRINDRLVQYKEKVYEIERQKKIEILLKEVANNQNKVMHRLKEDIKEISVYDNSAVYQIERLIRLSKQELKEVRETVNSYMNYYEQE